MMKNLKKSKLFLTGIIMVIFLQVDQILGMVWKKKRSKKERRCVQVNYVSFKTDWKVNPNCI